MKFLMAPIGLAIALGLGWLVYRDSLETAGAVDEKPPQRPVTVEVTRVARRPIEEHIELVGGLEAIAQVEIRSRISGYITDIPFDVSDTVEKGQIVVELDDSTHDELVSKSLASLRVAEAELKAQEARAALAKKTVERYQQLSRNGISTKQQLEEAESAHEVATAEIALQTASVEAAKAEVERAKLSRDETRIAAPMSGHILRRVVETGDLAKPDVPLLVIADLSRVRTIVHVVERDYAKIKIGQPAEIRVDTYRGKVFRGNVVRKAPVLDAETRTAEIHVEIENPETELLPGMHGRVRIVFEKRDEADVVPIASVIENGNLKQVYVVEGTPPESQLRNVVTGITDGAAIEIVSGVTPDQQVITLGNRLVASGQSVTPIEVPFDVVASRREKPAAGTAAE